MRREGRPAQLARAAPWRCASRAVRAYGRAVTVRHDELTPGIRCRKAGGSPLLGRGAEHDAEVVRRAEGAGGRGPTVLPPRSTAARVGILLGWVSVLETAALAAFLFTRGWPSAVCATGLAATGLVLLGLGAAENLPVPITTLTRTLRRTPLAVGLPLAGVILGSVLGRVAAHRADMAMEARCAMLRGQPATRAGENDFGASRAAIAGFERECKPTATELSVLQSEVYARVLEAGAREVEMKRQSEVEERACEAKVAAGREAAAVETFPKEIPEIMRAIGEAQAKAGRGQFEAASALLGNAQRALDEFKGTSVEQTKRFVDMSRQIADKKRALQPGLGRALAAREAVEARAPPARPYTSRTLFVAIDHAYLFNSLASSKAAGKVAALGTANEFTAFVREHGTRIERGARLERLEGVFHVRGEEDGTGRVGWISSEFLRSP